MKKSILLFIISLTIQFSLIAGNVYPMCQNYIVFHLDSNGEATLLPVHVDAGSYSDLPIDEMTVTPNKFTCLEAGKTIIVTLTVIDIKGNEASCYCEVYIKASDACSEDTPEESCEDGIKNGYETGIDCGGKYCDPCKKYPYNFSDNFVKSPKTSDKTICYPNPTLGIVNIDLPENEIQEIYIYNNQKKRVNYDTSSITTINLSNNKSGVYFIEILTIDGQISTHKVIKY